MNDLSFDRPVRSTPLLTGWPAELEDRVLAIALDAVGDEDCQINLLDLDGEPAIIAFVVEATDAHRDAS